jgi:hypothetical protein
MARTVITKRDLDGLPARHRVNIGKPSLGADLGFSEDRQLIPSGKLERADADSILDVITEKPDDYKARILKYIPAEVIALYLTFDALLRPVGGHALSQQRTFIYWLAFLFGLLVTPLYLWRIQKVSKITQLIISTVAFTVWVYALGGPFQTRASYDPLYGALALPAYTFLIAIFEA